MRKTQSAEFSQLVRIGSIGHFTEETTLEGLLN